MVKITFEGSLRRHDQERASRTVPGTLGEALRAHFETDRFMGLIVLTPEGHIRDKVEILINNKPITDRAGLSDIVTRGDTISLSRKP